MKRKEGKVVGLIPLSDNKTNKLIFVHKKSLFTQINYTSALSLAFSIRSCFSSVDMEASMVAVTMPQLGQQDLFMVSRMALVSSLSLSNSVFNNEFSWRSCSAYKRQ